MSSIRRRIERLEAIIEGSKPEARESASIEQIAEAISGAQGQLDQDPGNERLRALAALRKALEGMANSEQSRAES